VDTLTRRDALRLLLSGATLTAAGVYVPQRVYSFLWANPLARCDWVPPIGCATVLVTSLEMTVGEFMALSGAQVTVLNGVQVWAWPSALRVDGMGSIGDA
jgi:hypothetical protein